MTDPWQDHGACRSLPAEQFFPFTQDLQAVAAAKAVCATCDVRPSCLAHALARPEKHGIWGGKTAEERRAMQSNGVLRRATVTA